ncbi:MAG: formylmethanofuran--tetrahydromethanopterin N-formyltransferase [Promethearchaeota archaeon]|nr:MAG: formylmethanofuran--tetrahydromethanopterin N-formyltransferase [Candidatus Lokiarchaeota archaeon]
MDLNGVEIEDTYAEAFTMWCVRPLITAINEEWAEIAARVFSGYAVSTIACDCEAGIDMKVPANQTPDGRPGVSVLLFAGRKGLGNALMNRTGQCILTCPTTSMFDWLNQDASPYKDKKTGETKPAIFPTGKNMAFFGDGWQKSTTIGNRTVWNIPVMEGIFPIEDSFKALKAIGGGNFFILGDNLEHTLKASVDAVKAINAIEGVITSFPGGVCRSGSKTGSLKYAKFLHASTNHRFCPTLKDEIADSEIPDGVDCVLEIVLNGTSLKKVEEATAAGIKAAVQVPGIKKITAGNYGGTLGKDKVVLKEVLGL